jgi:hypothetical protein
MAGYSSGRAQRRPAANASVMAAALGLLLLFASSPALANCYELIGCTDSDYFQAAQLNQISCELLWEVRNTIYKERGYCFHTQKAIDFFSNVNCQYNDVGLVPLNDAERYNVAAIKKVEASKSCP